MSRQIELAIDRVPAILRDHGLREAHAYPLCSTGFGPEIEHPYSRRVPADIAWQRDYALIEATRSATATAALVFDCDNRKLAAKGLDDLPPYNWLTPSPSGGFHVAWTLERPVVFGPQATTIKPYRALGRISEFYQQALHADPDYAAALTRNPCRPGANTTWWRREPYALEELAEVIPVGWRRPTAARAMSAEGRNCAMFEDLMKWAGREANADTPVIERARWRNSKFRNPLPESEIAGQARKVEKYRDLWRRGWHKPRWIERQSYRGRRSGQVRRRKTEARDLEIIQLILTFEMPIAAAAALHNLTEGAVRHILNRDAPLLQRQFSPGRPRLKVVKPSAIRMRRLREKQSVTNS